MVPADRLEEFANSNVVSHNGVEDPFETEVGDAFKTVFEGIDAANGNGVGGRETLAGEEAEEGGFAGAVGSDKKGTGCWWEVEGDVL